MENNIYLKIIQGIILAGWFSMVFILIYNYKLYKKDQYKFEISEHELEILAKNRIERRSIIE
jgi:hypothetical protein